MNRGFIYGYVLLTLGIVSCIHLRAQITAEAFAGKSKSTLDIMFFKFFRNSEGSNSRFLFFNRNRASVDYRYDGVNYLPQFGFTEAISFNHSKLKGFAPVGVVQLLSSSVMLKCGFQFVSIKGNHTFFTWLVHRLGPFPELDFFMLFRYMPSLSKKMKLFSQLESLFTIPYIDRQNSSMVYRARLGSSFSDFQCGLGLDFFALGSQGWNPSIYPGVFFRYQF